MTMNPFNIRDRKNPCRQVLPDKPFTVVINGVPSYVIYNRPSDHPDHFVVRLWITTEHGSGPTGEFKLFDTLDEARHAVPRDCVCIARSPDDDPVIVETWI